MLSMVSGRMSRDRWMPLGMKRRECRYVNHTDVVRQEETEQADTAAFY